MYLTGAETETTTESSGNASNRVLLRFSYSPALIPGVNSPGFTVMREGSQERSRFEIRETDEGGGVIGREVGRMLKA